jgi:hypothetical protein
LFVLPANGLGWVAEGYIGSRFIILQKTVDREKKGVAVMEILDQRLGPPIWVRKDLKCNLMPSLRSHATAIKYI